MSNAIQYHTPQPRRGGISHFWAEKIRNYQQQREAVRKNRASIRLRDNELRQQLREAGLSWWELMKPEAYHLSDIVFADENIRAAVHGTSVDGVSVLMLVTNQRVICVSHTPLIVDDDEFSYDSVVGVSFYMGRWSSSVILYLTSGNFAIRTLNTEAAKKFITYAEEVMNENEEKTIQETAQLHASQTS